MLRKRASSKLAAASNLGPQSLMEKAGLAIAKLALAIQAVMPVAIGFFVALATMAAMD
jgi:NAD(P)H-hydrate repair Nnr-like enzyme with NAD(P)H-hydrate epimerase domain